MDLLGEIYSGYFLIQMGIFIGLMIILHFILFKPYIRLHEERMRRLNPDSPELRAAIEKGDANSAEYKAKIQAARERFITEVQKLRDETKRSEQIILTNAKKDAAARIQQTRERLEGEKIAAEKVIETEAEKIAFNLAASLLGRQIQ